MGLAAPAMAQDVNYKDMLKPIETTLKAGNADPKAFAKEIKEYQKEFKKDPKALVALGNLLAMNKNYDQANAVADAVIAKFKNYGDAYILKGDIYAMQDNGGEAAKERGIVVTNIPSYSTASVAQMVFAHILNISQQVQHHSEEVHKGRWTNSKDFCFWDTPLIELRDKKIGLVGLGNTGYTTARVAIGFGMQVYALTSKSHFQLPPEIKKMDLDQLFSECDIISLHCPLTPETHEMVNARRLAMMKPTAILINTGRGPLVNEQDLADALNSGKIFAAGVDVLSTEPPHADNPLLTAKNCYITPHIAWATLEARERLMNIAISNLQAYIAGTPENVVK